MHHNSSNRCGFWRVSSASQVRLGWRSGVLGDFEGRIGVPLVQLLWLSASFAAVACDDSRIRCRCLVADAGCSKHAGDDCSGGFHHQWTRNPVLNQPELNGRTEGQLNLAHPRFWHFEMWKTRTRLSFLIARRLFRQQLGAVRLYNPWNDTISSYIWGWNLSHRGTPSHHLF